MDVILEVDRDEQLAAWTENPPEFRNPRIGEVVYSVPARQRP
jgi:hypothetical protein